MDAAGMTKMMADLQRQMEVAGMKEEMMDDALADAFDDDEMEDEADDIVARTLAEIGIDLDSKMADAPTAAPVGGAAEEAPASAEQTAEISDLERRLADLPSIS